MMSSSRYWALRWAARVLAVLLGVVILVTTVQFVPAYLDDQVLSNKAGYLGTIFGAVALLVALIQFLGWLGRSEYPQAVTERLRPEIRKDLVRRLGQMKRTSEDISLSYRSSAPRSEASLAALTEAVLRRRQRVVLIGHPGRGKSYSALQVALEVIRSDPAVVPLVVPLSQWSDDEDVGAWLSRFVAAEFNISEVSARELIESGKTVALFDGLDELCAHETEVGAAERFLERVVEWRSQGDRTPFLLTCRRSTWEAVREELRNHHTLRTYAILPVEYTEATTYLSRSLGGTNVFRLAVDLADSLRAAGKEGLLMSPWQLSLIAEVAKDRLSSGPVGSGRDLTRVAASFDATSLVARYVASVGVIDGHLLRRLRNVLDLWWLSNYAKYLERNRTERVVVAGRPLPARDLVLHRLWPTAGRTVPLVVDFAMCVLLSTPGFIWLGQFLWGRGWLARAALIVGAVVWTVLLTRTSTQPWVRAATPNWSRLTNPRFFLPQIGAALAIGIVAWLILSPWAALICFVTTWLAVGLTVGFGQTLATDTRPEVVGPLGVLRRERAVSRLSAAVVFPAAAWGFSLTWGHRLGVGLALVYCVAVGETVACALWRRYLAMIIASAPRLPLAPARCLRRMSALGFTRVAGISYQFRHDDVLRYFAHAHNAHDHLLTSLRGRRPDRSRVPRRPVE